MTLEMPDRNARQMARRLGVCEFRGMGSSLKLCLVADGSAHLHPRLGPTMEWDTAAAHSIVEEAGGHYLQFSRRGIILQ